MKCALSIIAILAAMPAFAEDHLESGGADRWTGFYAGVTFDTANGSLDGTFMNGISTPFPTDGNARLDGHSAGIALGYNHQLGNVVVGGEIAVYATDLFGGESCPNAAFDCNFEVDNFATFSARAGYLVSNDLLVYGSAGLAAARARAFFDPAFGTPTFGDHSGFTYGMGGEYFVSEDVSFRGSINRYRFDDRLTVVGVGGNDVRTDFSFTTVEIGAFFHF